MKIQNEQQKNKYGWVCRSESDSHQKIREFVVCELQRLESKNVLDAGCGTGKLCSMISEIGMNVVGFDKRQGVIESAKRAYPALDFYVFDIELDNIHFEEASFDAVVSTEVIEHLSRPSKLIEMARYVLKDSGYFILTTPYHGYWKNLLIALLNKWDWHHTTLWEGGHIKFWSRKTLTRILNDYDFQIERWGGIGRVAYLWESMTVLAQKHS